MRQIIISAIKLYHNAFSSNVLQRCRYYPSCSQYAVDAINEKGVARGLFAALGRIIRCNPFSAGGFDPATPESYKEREDRK